MLRKKLIVLFAIITLCICIPVLASEDNLTPEPGNPLRKQVLDSLRNELKQQHKLDAVFIVKHLRVKDGWAWVHTLPQSPDGKNRYEDFSALLQLNNDVWQVVEIPCWEPDETDNPKCIGNPGYFKHLKKRFPNAPTDIFPE